MQTTEEPVAMATWRAIARLTIAVDLEGKLIHELSAFSSHAAVERCAQLRKTGTDSQGN